MSNQILRKKPSLRTALGQTSAALICAATLLSGPATAYEEEWNTPEEVPTGEDAGIYVGGGYGWLSFDDSDFEDDDQSAEVFLGAKFHPYIGAEVAYHDFGEAESGLFTAEFEGITAAAVGYIPVVEGFTLFAKAGQLWWESDVEVLGSFDDKLDGSEFFYGIGAKLNMTENLSLRAEYERYKIDLDSDEVGVDFDDNSDLNIASVGLQLNF